MASQIYQHDADSKVLQQALHQSLPNSVGLVYRTKHANQTEHAHILASFPPDTEAIPICWVAAYFDRSMRPETELWIYASGETHSTPTSFCSECRAAILALVHHISTLPVPPLDNSNPYLALAKQHEKEHPETGPDARYPPSPGSYLRNLLLPAVVTLGACHDGIVKVLDEEGMIRKELPNRDAELNKFVFKVSDLPQTRNLPEGFQWGELRDQDIAIVRSRTSFPRAKETLLSLKSVGVFDQEHNAVAWTFLGLDGSLTSLHVEPEYRNKGIAKAVAAKIFRQYAPALAVDATKTAWAHADVFVDNSQSEAVCRSLGGKVGWQMFWVRIDLGRAPEPAASS
ncbi:hypothetical protein EJ04DRAFT_355932 [Polyplosphaeria fusca]|uniref:GCN5-related N-acetyltransferase Rv2170-like domain-containing protein n=1 Tax=Polyplosphaeria fusca TaxID=682080 RepID=A0A9P4V7F5_9PLEO|nr:hypothetical protein EJ04DRAFT_355932 [Polyplosphaeria fusca]